VDEARAKGRIKLPVAEAFRISVEQIRRRLNRSSIMIGSIAISVAFMSHFTVMDLVFEAYGKQAGFTVETYQIWLIVMSFIVGIISLANSTLIAVYERYREIGAMKSMGALDRHVLELFLFEASIYGLIGGVVGFICGTVSAVASASYPVGGRFIPLVCSPGFFTRLSISVGLAVAVSVAATSFPAFRASRLRPVEALEYEI
jgi:putative ABC transport system permease protein